MRNTFKTFKLLIIILILIACFSAQKVFATTLNGRFVVVKKDSSTLSILIQINTNTGNDDMGGATFVISFNDEALNFPSDPSANKNYQFHNFNGDNYNIATITKPFSDKLFINIFLPASKNNKGEVVSGGNNWTDFVTINFDIKNSLDTARVNWLEGNLFWQIYDADNSTIWTIGNLNDLVYPLGTTTDVENNREVPLKYTLEQNYPNPFNPNTTISYQVPVNSNVSLKVYDVLGNEVAALVDEYKPAGSYNIEFSGENLSSGVYFYTIQARAFVETRKMVLLK